MVHPVVKDVDGDGKSFSYHIMPVGLFAISDLLYRNGFECKILNVGVEKLLNPNFSLGKYLRKYEIGVVAIDLHWYVHSYNAIELAREVKENSTAKVVLGGFTASFFDSEILNFSQFVDAVIRGEGEVPLLEYVRMNGVDAEEINARVPNLTYRHKGQLIRSKKSYVPDEEDLNRLDYSNISLLEHWREYAKISMKLAPGVDTINTRQPANSLFYVLVGRGCNTNCSYCGGGANAYFKITGRKKPCLRSIESVVAEIRKLYDCGISTFYFEYDPRLSNEKHYIELFNQIKKERMDIGVNFGCWLLPKEDFLKAFLETFDIRRSCIAISPESGSEEVRRINKGIYYSNRSLFKALEMMKDKNIYSSVHFTIGLPGESSTDFQTTLRICDCISKNFYAGPRIDTVPLEPASPMFLYPNKYKIQKYRETFTDYYSWAKARAKSMVPLHPLGYRTEYFSEWNIIKLKIKAYRRLYLRPGYVLDRWSKTKSKEEAMKYLKVFLGTVLGLTRIIYTEK